MRTAFRALILIAVLVAVSAAVLWLARVPLAEVYLDRWCRERALACEAQITSIDPNRLTASNVSVTTDEGVPLSISEADIGWRWTGPFGIAVDEVSLASPSLRADFDGRALSFLGLERALPEPGGDGQPLPAVRVTDGRMVVKTPAGAVTADLRADIAGADAGDLEMAIQPVSLTRGEDLLVIDEAILDLALRDGVLSGEGSLQLAEARLGRFSARAIDATLAVSEPEGAELRALTWRADIAEVETGTLAVETMRLDGSLNTRALSGFHPAALLSAVQSADVSATAERARWNGAASGAITADASLSADDEGLRGPVSLSGEALASGFGTAESLTITGDALINGLAEQHFGGVMTVDGGSLAPDIRSGLIGRLPPIQGFAAHDAALRQATDGALEAFQLGLKGEVSRTSGSWAYRLRDRTRFVAGTGAKLIVEPFNRPDWLEAGDGSVTVNGRVAVAGGGMPDLSVSIDRATLGADGLRARLSEINLSDWAVQGQALGAELDRLSVDIPQTEARTEVDAGPRIDAAGTVRVSGPVGAADLAPTSLFGAVTAVQSGGAWRVQTAGEDCLALSSAGAAIQAVRLGAFSTTLCPQGGRLSSGRGGPGGQVMRFDRLRLPYTLGDGGGVLRLDGGTLRWRTDDGFALSLSSETAAQDYATASSDYRVEGRQSEIDITLGGGPIGVAMTLGRTEVRGSPLPADLTMAGLDLTTTRRDGRFSGFGTLRDIRLTAPGDDPVFQPLLTTQDMRIDGSTLTLSGPVRLAQTGATVADSQVSLSLPSLSGTGIVTTPRLTFRPGGLQPSDLSERLRGLLTDARGAARAKAQITIDRGRPRVAAELSLDDLGFQTVALGRVAGVGGTIAFDDFLSLSTPPGQQVRVGSVDPGLSLEDGEVSFQMLGPQALEIETARWPFAGGSLTVAPGRWQIGGLDNRLDIEADNLDLNAVVETFDLPDVTASGEVSGRFPLVFSGSDALISGARLQATESGGTLRYTGDIGRAAGDMNEAAQLAFDALRNFQFTVLEIGADGNLSGNITLSIKLLGKNPDVLYGTPFDFNLSVDAPLMRLLQTGASLRGTSWLADAIVQEQQQQSE